MDKKKVDVVVEAITPVYPSRKAARQAGVKDRTVEDIVSDIMFDPAIQKKFMRIHNEQVNPVIMNARELRQRAPNYFQGFSGKVEEDMYNVFFNDRLEGCNVSVKVPNPNVVGKGLHVNVRYFYPNNRSYNVFPLEKSGQAGSHFWSPYIRRSEKWEETMKEGVTEGLNICLDKDATEMTPAPRAAATAHAPAPTLDTYSVLWTAAGKIGYGGRCLTKNPPSNGVECKSVLVKRQGKSIFFKIERNDVPNNVFDGIRKQSTIQVDPNALVSCVQASNSQYPDTWNCDFRHGSRMDLL